MAEQKRQFPTPAMLKAEEEWQKKTPQEREAIEKKLEEKFRKYYANRPSRGMIIASMEEDQTE